MSTSGLRLKALLRRPAVDAGPRTAALLLGGLGTGRDCVRSVPAEANAVIWLSFDYPYEAPQRLPDLLAIPGELREAGRATHRAVAAMSLALDYLESRADVDTSRTLVVGGSLGAFCAVTGGAVDPRFDGVVSLFGGGRLTDITGNVLRIKPRWLRGPVARALNPWLGPVDPVHFAGRIAPRPLLLVNGGNDRMIPRECVEALFAAAGEPKELRWVEAPHRILKAPDVLEVVSGVLLDWMGRHALLAPLAGPPEGGSDGGQDHGP